MKKILIAIPCLFLFFYSSNAQQVGASPEYIKALTSQWKGPRFEDGRPKVSDAILHRLKKVAMEEAWDYLRGHGFENQFEADWKILHADSPMTGRVVTAQYMPERPDFKKVIRTAGLLKVPTALVVPTRVPLIF